MVLTEYQQLCASQQDNSLFSVDWSPLFDNKYTEVALVNDFNYILDVFNEDEDLELLHNKLIQSLPDSCDLYSIEDGSIGHRHLVCDQFGPLYADKESIIKLYHGAVYDDVVRYRLLDKIYCHIAFPQYLGLRLKNEEIQMMAKSTSSLVPLVVVFPLHFR